MELYYDKRTLLFGTEKTDVSECVFETYDKYDKSRIGRKKGTNPPIERGNLKITIKTNFWPEKVSCEWFQADITLNDILLRPLSQCYNNGRFSKPNHTIGMTHENFDWDVFLGEICNICNHSDAWLNSELEKLLVKLPLDSSNIEEQIRILKLLREFDSTNRYFIEKYRKHFDPLLFDKETVLPQFEKMFTQMETSSIEGFDVIWSYIKDYHQNII